MNKCCWLLLELRQWRRYCKRPFLIGLVLLIPPLLLTGCSELPWTCRPEVTIQQPPLLTTPHDLVGMVDVGVLQCSKPLN